VDQGSAVTRSNGSAEVGSRRNGRRQSAPTMRCGLRPCKATDGTVLCQRAFGNTESGADRIRTCGTGFPVHRFSKPALSTTQPPLLYPVATLRGRSSELDSGRRSRDWQPRNGHECPSRRRFFPSPSVSLPDIRCRTRARGLLVEGSRSVLPRGAPRGHNDKRVFVTAPIRPDRDRDFILESLDRFRRRV